MLHPQPLRKKVPKPTLVASLLSTQEQPQPIASSTVSTLVAKVNATIADLHARIRSDNSPAQSSLSMWKSFEEDKVNPLLDKMYATCADLLQRWLPDQANQTRHHQLATLLTLAQSQTIDKEEQATNRTLMLAGSVLAFNTLAAICYPSLMVLSAPLLLRSAIPFLQEARQQWRQQGRVGTALLDVIIITGMVAAGAFWTAGLFDLFFAYSQKVQLKTRDQMQKKLVNILGETPRFVWVEENGVEVTLPIEQAQYGDEIMVHAGEMIPVDGTILAGTVTIDQQMLTGEARPAEKSVGDSVYAGTIVLSGAMRVSLEKAGNETVAGQVGEILRHTADYRSTIELRGQRLADQSVLPSLAVGAITLTTLGTARATAAITCSIGYQMKFTGPLSVLNFLELAADRGILIKDGRALEQICQIDTVVFDKTGTLTQSQPQIAEIHALPGFEADTLLRLAAAVEAKQTHPIARAILAEAKRRQLDLPATAETTYVVGYGLKATIAETVVQVGSARYMQQEAILLPEQMDALAAHCCQQGHLLVYIAFDGTLAGVIELHTILRPEARQVIHTLKQHGLALYVISGDHAHPTRRLAHDLGIDHYFAEVLPTEKANLIEQLQQQGKKVCFVGDGINDAIALKQADVSVSLRGATTIALDTAQMILRNESLQGLAELFPLADHFEANMQVNFWASTLPGMISLAGVYLWHFNIFAASLLAWSGLTIGMINALSPLVQRAHSPTINKGETDGCA